MSTGANPATHCPAAVTNGYSERYAARPLTHSRDRCDLLENRDDDRFASGDELLAVRRSHLPSSFDVQGDPSGTTRRASRTPTTRILTRSPCSHEHDPQQPTTARRGPSDDTGYTKFLTVPLVWVGVTIVSAGNHE
jgi:hypothetical protein